MPSRWQKEEIAFTHLPVEQDLSVKISSKANKWIDMISWVYILISLGIRDTS